MQGIMKKFRLKPQNPWEVYGKFALFFALWNFIGYKLYQKMSRSGKEKNPNFDNLPYSQKILTFFNNPSEEIQVVSLEGMKIKSIKTQSIRDFGKGPTKNDETESSNVPCDPEPLKN